MSCRQVVLGECEVTPDLAEERTWERRNDFLLLNPAGTVPVLVEHDGPPISGVWAISEYLDETRGFALNERRLLSAHAEQRAEVRRLCDWFLYKFDEEVTAYLVEEKVIKREKAKTGGNGGAPDSSLLRAARAEAILSGGDTSVSFDLREKHATASWSGDVVAIPENAAISIRTARQEVADPSSAAFRFFSDGKSSGQF